MLYRPCLKFVLGLVLSAALYGQTGTIQGVLTDPGGATIPNAKVTAVDEAKKLVIREATTLLFGYMNEEQSKLKGRVLGHAITPRALGYIIIGHTIHHMNIVRQRYLV